MTMLRSYGVLVAVLVAAPGAAQVSGRPAWTGDPPLAGSIPVMDEPAGRPRHAGGPLFISPMGEPFHGPSPPTIWFGQADADRDGRVSRAEFVRDAERFFAVLDRGHDGEIDPDDIDHYETVLAPEIGSGGGGGGQPSAGGRRGGGGRHGRGRGGGGGGPTSAGSGAGGDTQHYADQPRGAARFGWFDYPEPVVVADTNMNRGIDPAEFRHAAEERFAALDKNGDGVLTRGELPPLPAAGHRGRGGLDFAGVQRGTPASEPPE